MIDYKEFINPSNKYRGKPFWSWNGKLEKKELLKQIDYMKQMGFGGFFMHSRVGLRTKYLGDEWFELINSCTDKAESLGMEPWIYDEDRWPSGTAGGMVTKKKENRMKFILMHINEDIPQKAEVISAFNCTLHGIDFKNKKRINNFDKSDEDLLWFEVVEFPKSNFYNGYTYADTLNKETTKDFIKITHEKYKEKCEDRIGKTIKGVFTDEPHRGAVMCDDIFNGLSVPYTNNLFDCFIEKWGYDLKEFLPELFLRKDGEKVNQVKWHYIELIQQMFIDNFAKPIHDWCRENNMILTGHVLHEDTLSAQTIMQGSLMRFYEYMDYPGVDVLKEHNINFCIVKQLTSVAHQLGKEWLLSELYGLTGWQTNFESHKNIGDWQALMGINLRCHHLSWYTMEGEAKRDYPASILHQSTWYEEYKYVEDYFSRIGMFLNRGNHVENCLVINPIESIWCQVYANWSTWLDTKTEDTKEIEDHYKNLCNWLLESNVNFDLADEEMLARIYKIEDKVLYVGKAKYDKVIISGMLTIRKSTLEILKEFKAKGGEVIILGDKPKYVDALPQDIDLKATLMDFTKENIKSFTNPFIAIEDEKIFVEVKKENESFYIMMLNTDRNKSVKTKVDINIKGYIEKWDAREGNRYKMNSIDNLYFEPGEEKLFVITREDNKLPYFKNEKYENEIYLNEPVSYKLSEPNICVLDFAKCSIGDEILEETDILKIDRKLRERFKLGYRGGEMLQPWFTAEKNPSNLGKVNLEYKFYVETKISDIELVVENAEKLDIKINGNKISKVCGKWIDICFDKIKLPKEFIKKGENNIVIQTMFNENTNLEAIYLLGDFGVETNKDKNILVDLPEKIGFGELKNYKLPFYSGKIKYIFNNELDLSGKVKLEKMFGAACVKINDEIVAFNPYEKIVKTTKSIEIELILTRRNTFGPLHQKNMYASGYGPDNFITTGEDYSRDYRIYPTGITKAPKLLF